MIYYDEYIRYSTQPLRNRANSWNQHLLRFSAVNNSGFTGSPAVGES